MSAIATWSFGERVVKKAKFFIDNNTSSADAIVKSISEFEDDISTGPYLVGRGGYPNLEGVLQCDAAIMTGHDLQFGAVGSLEGISTPMQVADGVRKNSNHSFLVGTGAQQFARSQGNTITKNENLITENGKRLYEAYLEKGTNTTPIHSLDTLGLIAMDKHGNISAGVSTSGMSLKYPGRIGDSPLPGCGLYADNTVGAACATGDGDKIMKFCPCFHIVMLMRMGKSPTQACQETIQHICKRWTQAQPGKNMFEIGVIAMNDKGECGAATSISEWKDDVTGEKYKGFPFAVWSPLESNKVEVKVSSAEKT